MRRFFPPSLLCILLAVIACSKPAGEKDPDPKPEPGQPTPVTWTKPSYFPEPTYDLSQNPLTEEGIELGRFLFYDGILSRTDNIGCGTCHQQQVAFTHHGHELSHGVDDLLGIRNAPPVQNLAWSTSFFWDGVVHKMDSISFNPIGNPVELDETMDNVIAKLRNTPVAGAKKQVDYPRMFKAAFGTDEINSERVTKALSQFMMTLVSATSRYDYYLRGDQAAITSLEKQGLEIFNQKCASCHSGTLFSDQQFRNNGLRPQRLNDQGRFNVTLKEADRLKFKVPSLRNVGLTAPYMHDGRFQSLEQVLDHYANEAGSATDSIFLSLSLDPILKENKSRPGIALTAAEKQAIIAFLRTLTDEDFIRDARFSDPGIGTAF